MLLAIYSGWLFFFAAGLLLVAMFLPRRVAGVLALLSIPLAALGGPLSGTLLLAIAYALWASRRRALIAPAVLSLLIAAALEIPHHRNVKMPRPSRIFVVGDSLASGGFGESAPWPDVLAQRLATPVVNLAMASGDTATALERQIPQLSPPRDGRELVLIEIGGNDMLDGVGSAAFSRQLDTLLARAGEKRSLAMFELPLLPGRWSYGSTQRRLARKHGCTLIPKRVLARVLLAPGNTLDGIHLTQQGHDALASELLRRFRAAGSSSS